MRIYKKIIEQVTITGSMEEKSKILDYAYNNGYKVIRCGPKQISLTRVDPNKYMVVAERRKIG